MTLTLTLGQEVVAALSPAAGWGTSASLPPVVAALSPAASWGTSASLPPVVAALSPAAGWGHPPALRRWLILSDFPVVISRDET